MKPQIQQHMCFCVLLFCILVVGCRAAVTRNNFPPESVLDSCPEVPPEERIDCHPDDGPSQSNCQDRGCLWCPPTEQDVPTCYYNSTAWPPIPHDDEHRVDCHPGPDATKENCQARGCIYEEPATPGAPSCYLPLNYGYKMTGDPQPTEDGTLVTLKRIPLHTLYGNDSDIIYLEITFTSDSQLRIKITNGQQGRFEVPLNTSASQVSKANSNPLYTLVYHNEPFFSFQVIRSETRTVLFDTSLGGLTFSDQFLQIGALLPSKNVYGFGENEQFTFRHDLNWKTYGMWSRDQSPDGDINSYGAYPRYTVVEDDGNVHGVLILNSNAQEVSLLPTPGLIYRTIGGILDLYFFLGPTPENVVQQYTELVGRAPLPPYWSLGFQLSKWQYNSLEAMKQVDERTLAAKIPQDVQYGDIDVMDRYLDFTYDKKNFSGLPEYVQELLAKGIKFVPIVDPGISTGEKAGTYPPYDVGMKLDMWVKKQDGGNVLGKVWPYDPVYYPDFTNPKAHEWITIILKEFKEVIDWSGIWLDMNEPSNFVTGDLRTGCVHNNLNYPPYKPKIFGNILSNRSLCLDHKQTAGLHYDVHSLYGWSESEATHNAILAVREGKRAFVLSRSTYPGSGRWTAHWLGDNFSTWSNLRNSIIGMLQFNQFGIPLVGADICGFNGEATPELCQRWMQLGAFYPFSRNHNTAVSRPQDPASWGERVVNSSRTALNIRYTLLPYLYTLFYHHHTTGSTVARALWHEYPHDVTALGINHQFMWGPAFLISPVVIQNSVTVQAYFPQDTWYSYYNGEVVTPIGKTLTLSAPKNFIPLHVRGGHIIPTQEPDLNTVLSRQKPLGLIVALDSKREAEGTLYYDDGDSANSVEDKQYFLATFSVQKSTLQVNHIEDGYPDISKLNFGTIRVFGAGKVNSVKVNGGDHQDFVLSHNNQELTIKNINVVANSKFTVQWA